MKSFFEQMLETLVASVGGGRWKPFVYASTNHSLDTSAAITTDGTIQSGDNRPFIWTHGSYKTNSSGIMAGTDTLRGGALFEMNEVGDLGPIASQSRPAHLDAFFSRGGTSMGPRKLPVPVLWKGGSNIVYKLTNVSGGSITVELNFIGLKQVA